MKKALTFLMGCSLLFMGCRHDDVLGNDPHQSQEENGLKGKNFVLTQEQLEAKYVGNKSLNNILQKEFKMEGGLIKTNSEDGGKNGVYIDLDHVQVFESPQMHSITYYVEIGEQEETNEPQEVYNLMYFSKDYENYHVILFRYDFSQIPFQQFIMHPELTTDILGFIPLNDIENIYENIDYSISHGLMSTSSVQTTNASATVVRQFIDCLIVTIIPAQPCQACGQYKGEVRNGRVCTNTNPETMPVEGSVTYDFSGCGGSGGGGTGGNPGSGGGGGSVGLPGGGNPGGGGGSTPSNPIKFPVDMIDAGLIVSRISFYKTNHNHKTLKAISNSSVIKADLIDFDSKLKQIREFGNAYAFKETIITHNNKKIEKKYEYSHKLTLPNPTGVNTKIDASSANSSYAGVIHSHPEHLGSLSKQGAPLFSMGDLVSVFKYANETPVSKNRKPAEAFIGAVNKYGLYMVMLPNDVDNTNLAIRYADFTKTTPIGNDIVGDETKPKWVDIDKELTDRYQEIESSGDPEHLKKTAHEKALLQVMKKYGLEMNIYFLPRNSGTFNDTWQQVTLNNNGQVQYTNIN